MSFFFDKKKNIYFASKGLLSYLKGNDKVNSGKDWSWDLSVSIVTPLTYLGISLDCTLENFVPH